MLLGAAWDMTAYGRTRPVNQLKKSFLTVCNGFKRGRGIPLPMNLIKTCQRIYSSIHKKNDYKVSTQLQTNTNVMRAWLI